VTATTTSHTLSSDEFRADPNTAVDATGSGPVFITSKGNLEVVMMSYRDYCILRFGDFQSAARLLGIGGAGDVDLEATLPERDEIQREVSL
jgi:hypothetical protein